MPIPVKPCDGSFSEETNQLLLKNVDRAQWNLHPCQRCGQQVGARLEKGHWAPETHWPFSPSAPSSQKAMSDPLSITALNPHSANSPTLLETGNPAAASETIVGGSTGALPGRTSSHRISTALRGSHDSIRTVSSQHRPSSALQFLHSLSPPPPLLAPCPPRLRSRRN